MLMKKSSYTKLGREINDYLEKMRWSQRELARRTNISSSNISKLMRGKHTPTPETLTIIGNALGIDPMHLMRLADILPSSDKNGRDPAIEYLAQRLERMPLLARSPTIEFISTQIDAIEAVYSEVNSLSKGKHFDAALDAVSGGEVVVEPIYERDPPDVRRVKIAKIVDQFSVLYPMEFEMLRSVLGDPSKISELEFA